MNQIMCPLKVLTYLAIGDVIHARDPLLPPSEESCATRKCTKTSQLGCEGAHRGHGVTFLMNACWTNTPVTDKYRSTDGLGVFGEENTQETLRRADGGKNCRQTRQKSITGHLGIVKSCDHQISELFLSQRALGL